MTIRTELPFLAGVDDEEQPVFESLPVEIVDPSNHSVRLLQSPLFARNLAAGDKIKVINPATAEYELLQRSGNLSLRVFRKQQIEELAEWLSPAVEKMGGTLDTQTERALVFSIHFSIGFSSIEALFNKACTDYPQTVWYYGNVYDPTDGTTPLLWWQDFDSLD